MEAAITVQTRKRLANFVLGYIVFFTALALCGYYWVGTGTKFKPPSYTQGYSSDLAYYDLPRMTIAIGSEGNKTHVRLDISLEIAKKDVPVLEGFQPMIAERLTKYLLSLPPDQFRHFAELPELRQEMLRQINSVGAPAPVHDLLLRQLIVM